ncbi:MAG: hypothetical protein M3139_15310 [Bacteroidota bacterium]|nr:hypothetical protein [Bacteroidota bacterium]
MRVHFMYEDLNGKELPIRIAGKVLVNQNDVIRQLFDNIAYGYVLVTVGKDGDTFQNTWMTGCFNFSTGIEITSIHPLQLLSPFCI